MPGKGRRLVIDLTHQEYGISLIMGMKNWLDLFQGKGINCRDAFFSIIDLLIFINILKEYWAIDNLETLDNSVERSNLQFGFPEII